MLAYKDHGGEKGLTISVDAPFAVEGQRQDRQDHHLHRVGHPTQANHQRQQYLYICNVHVGFFEVVDRIKGRHM